MLLRRYHKVEEPKKQVEVIAEVPLQNGESLIEEIGQAYEIAIKENEIRILKDLKVDELKELAKEKEIEGYSKMKKEELIEALRGE